MDGFFYEVTGLTKGVKDKGQLKFCVAPPISRSSSSSESSPSSVLNISNRFAAESKQQYLFQEAQSGVA